jgi:hypothetical protein
MMRSRSVGDLLVSGSTSPGDADRIGAPRVIRTSYYAEHFRRLRETWRVAWSLRVDDRGGP